MRISFFMMDAVGSVEGGNWMEFAVRSVNGEAECGGFFGGRANGLMSPKSDEGTGQGRPGGAFKKSQTFYQKVSWGALQGRWDVGLRSG